MKKRSASPARRAWPWAAAALLAGPLAAAQSPPRPAAPAPPPGTASAAPARPAATASTAPPAGRAPALTAEPTPSMTRRKWAYDVRLTGGQLSAAAPALVDRGRPLATPRLLGRFAIELFVGNVLLDRVRFDLPLVDAEPNLPGSTAKGASALPKKLRTHRVVEVPDLERATRAELVDRATGQRLRLPWPPVDGPPAPPPAAPPAR